MPLNSIFIMTCLEGSQLAIQFALRTVCRCGGGDDNNFSRLVDFDARDFHPCRYHCLNGAGDVGLSEGAEGARHGQPSEDAAQRMEARFAVSWLLRGSLNASARGKNRPASIGKAARPRVRNMFKSAALGTILPPDIQLMKLIAPSICGSAIATTVTVFKAAWFSRRRASSAAA